MKKLLILAAAVAMFASCSQEPKVMARFVPERLDDFVFENNLIAGRFYGEALEGNPTSPGVDIWVKTPGKLVADERYKGYVTEGDAYYHHDRGNGKDCYKVSVSLGGGASVPFCENSGKLFFPPTNFRSYEILEQTPNKVVFVLNYPEWQAHHHKVSLSKKVTVTPDTYFVKVEDSYTFTGDSLHVACGVFRHIAQETIEQEHVTNKAYALWEHASDQSHEPEEGMLGVAVYCPDADGAGLSADKTHGVAYKTIAPGETFTYYFGSCWSKAKIKSAEDWFKLVDSL